MKIRLRKPFRIARKPAYKPFKIVRPHVHQSRLDLSDIRDDDLYAVSTYSLSRGYYKTKVFEGYRLKYEDDLRSLGIIIRRRQAGSVPLRVGGTKTTFIQVSKDFGFDAQWVDPKKHAEASAETLNKRIGW